MAAAQGERFTRKKHDAEFLQNTIRYCLDAGAMRLDQIDPVVFCEKTFLKFKRLLFAEHHQSHAASAFFASPFEDAITLTMNGDEEWTLCAANRSSAVRRMFSSVLWGQSGIACDRQFRPLQGKTRSAAEDEL